MRKPVKKPSKAVIESNWPGAETAIPTITAKPTMIEFTGLVSIMRSIVLLIIDSSRYQT